MFHVGMWRERMRNALTELAEGRPQTTRPAAVGDVNELNDAELANGIGTPLSDAAARSDHLLSEIAELYAKVGERPIDWNEAKTTTVAVLRNSYTHPRLHLFEYYQENDQPDTAIKLFEDAVSEMNTAEAPDFVMGTVLYNLATVRAQQDRKDEALGLLGEAIQHRADSKSTAAGDSDFATLRDDPKFQEMVKP